MPSQPEFRGVPLPSSLVLRHGPTFAIYDDHGLPLELDQNFDPKVDPMVYIETDQTTALLKWGEQHAESLLFDETIALTDRQFFAYRGLMMEAARLYHHRARFARMEALSGALDVVAAFLVKEPSSYGAAFAIMPPSYSAVTHAAGTAVLTAAIYSGMLSADGDTVGPGELASALLAGVAADLGLVNSHRDLLSFDRTMTPPERNILRAHPMSADRILKHIGEQRQEVLDGVMYHHERADGSGYPLALASIAVPRLAQCVGLADTFLALITQRPGRPASSPVTALGAVATGEFTRRAVSSLAELVASSAGAAPLASAAS